MRRSRAKCASEIHANFWFIVANKANICDKDVDFVYSFQYTGHLYIKSSRLRFELIRRRSIYSSSLSSLSNADFWQAAQCQTSTLSNSRIYRFTTRNKYFILDISRHRTNDIKVNCRTTESIGAQLAFNCVAPVNTPWRIKPRLTKRTLSCLVLKSETNRSRQLTSVKRKMCNNLIRSKVTSKNPPILLVAPLVDCSNCYSIVQPTHAVVQDQNVCLFTHLKQWDNSQRAHEPTCGMPRVVNVPS